MNPTLAFVGQHRANHGEQEQRLGVDGGVEHGKGVARQQRHPCGRRGRVAKIVARELVKQHQRPEKRHVRDHQAASTGRDTAAAEQPAHHAHRHRERREEHDVLLASDVSRRPHVADARDAQVPARVPAQRQVDQIAVGDAQRRRIRADADREECQPADQEHAGTGDQEGRPRRAPALETGEPCHPAGNAGGEGGPRHQRVPHNTHRSAQQQRQPRRHDRHAEEASSHAEPAADGDSERDERQDERGDVRDHWRHSCHCSLSPMRPSLVTLLPPFCHRPRVTVATSLHRQTQRGQSPRYPSPASPAERAHDPRPVPAQPPLASQRTRRDRDVHLPARRRPSAPSRPSMPSSTPWCCGPSASPTRIAWR